MAKKPLPRAVMFGLITGRGVSHLIFVAAKLGLADLLKDGPRTVEELARAAEVQAPALYRLLRTLASFGVFAETRDKRFKLTRLATTLQKGVPGSLRAVALHHSLRYREDAWRNCSTESKQAKCHFSRHTESPTSSTSTSTLKSSRSSASR